MCTKPRVRTDLEKSFLTLVLENSWNLKIVPFVLELSWNFVILPNMKLSLKIIKYIDSFRFFSIYVMRKRKLSEIAGYVEERDATPY